MKKDMRRNEKAISRDECVQVLDTAEYGVLSTVSTDGTPYGTPLNFVYCDGAVYFHCAPEGHKIENIQHNSNACFNVVDSVVLMPEKFNTQYRSVTVFGTVAIVEDKKEKMTAITSIAAKLSPAFAEEAAAYIKSAFDDIHILKLTIDHMTGKAPRE